MRQSGGKGKIRLRLFGLARRALLEKSRGRLVLAAAGFGLLFGAVGVKLTVATVVDPREPRRIAREVAAPPAPEPVSARAAITDRNGEILAVSLPVTALVDQFYKDVQKMGGGRWDTSSLFARLRNLG